MSSSPRPIEPDAKDWTWVLGRPCPDCGFVAADHDPAATGDAVRRTADRLAELLGDERAGARPEPGQWSAVEYGCHVRDVFRLFDRRLHLMLDEHDPLFDNWDQDETALADDYAAQRADVVAGELAAAAAVVADSFDAVRPEQLERRGRRSDGASFTVTTFAQYFLHDPVHHVWDIERGYDRLG